MKKKSFNELTDEEQTKVAEAAGQLGSKLVDGINGILNNCTLDNPSYEHLIVPLAVSVCATTALCNYYDKEEAVDLLKSATKFLYEYGYIKVDTDDEQADS